MISYYQFKSSSNTHDVASTALQRSSVAHQWRSQLGLTTHRSTYSRADASGMYVQVIANFDAIADTVRVDFPHAAHVMNNTPVRFFR